MTMHLRSRLGLAGAVAAVLLLSSACGWLGPRSGSRAPSMAPPPVVVAVPKPVAAVPPVLAAPPPPAASATVPAAAAEPPPAVAELPAPAAAPAVASPPPAPPSVLPPARPPSTSIHFGNDAYLVRPEFDAMLKAHAEYLKAHPQLRLQVRGHTDARGSQDYNRALAAKRAEMVVKALRSHGVDASQLAPVSLGKSGQADGPGSAGDRRVELVYLRSDSGLR